jgi:hypothetical protein
MEHKLGHYPKASTLYKRFHIWGALVLMVCKGPPLSHITPNKRFYYICKSKLSAFVRHFKKWNANRIEKWNTCSNRHYIFQNAQCHFFP